MPEVVVVDYDPLWPSRFAEERARLSAALGPRLLAIEHIGSTAVPGLSAKPIVDVMASVAELDAARRMRKDIEALGYLYRPEFEATLPGRLFFERGSPRTHHLHVVEARSDYFRTHLLFRDRLRARPEVAAAYEALKQALARAFPDERQRYTDAKAPFIAWVLAQP